MTALIFAFDFKDAHSYLAIEPTIALIDELAIACTWRPFLTANPEPQQPPAADADRGTLHLWWRAQHFEKNLIAYAAAMKLPARHFADGGPYRQTTGVVAALGFNWIKDHDQALTYLRKAFLQYWDDEFDLDSASQVETLMESCGVSASGFSNYLKCAGPKTLAAQREELAAAGCFTPATYLLGKDIYCGRHHLPALRWELMDRQGPPPV